MKLTVFGTGYVGLVQAVCLADVGHQVCCIDIDSARVDRLNRGEPVIFEPGLTPLLQRNLAAQRLHFSSDASAGIDHADLLFIAVGTPATAEGDADLSQIWSVADAIARHARRGKLIVNKSTAPVGTAQEILRRVRQGLAARHQRFDIEVVANPEFLKEGSAVEDCLRPDRIILGSENPAALAPLYELYGPFCRNHDKFIVMDTRSAELTKYAANGLLATKISFMNEMAELAERFGADIELVRKGVGSDPRIGYHFIYPGCGFGGSCFPKDLKAIRHAAGACQGATPLLDAVELVNQRQKHKLFEKIRHHYHGRLHGKTIALWGLAFKPQTSDMREAPSRALIEDLWQAGARIRAFDPEAMPEAEHLYGTRPDLVLCESKEAAVAGADALAVVTEWMNFRTADYAYLHDHLRDRVVFDGRNIFEPERMRAAGLNYFAIGRPAVMCAESAYHDASRSMNA